VPVPSFDTALDAVVVSSNDAADRGGDRVTPRHPWRFGRDGSDSRMTPHLQDSCRLERGHLPRLSRTRPHCEQAMRRRRLVHDQRRPARRATRALDRWWHHPYFVERPPCTRRPALPLGRHRAACFRRTTTTAAAAWSLREKDVATRPTGRRRELDGVSIRTAVCLDRHMQRSHDPRAASGVLPAAACAAPQAGHFLLGDERYPCAELGLREVLAFNGSRQVPSPRRRGELFNCCRH